MGKPAAGPFDVIVVGLGAMGSAAAYHLAKRGLHVLGLDAFERGHTRGSSHGSSRAIRKAYFQAREYVPLVERAYVLWRQLEDESGQELLRTTGSLLVGTPQSRHIAGTILSARLYRLPFESLSASDVAKRFPGFCLDDDLVAVYEPSGGVLHPQRCMTAYLDLARRSGAQLRHEEAVRDWAAEGTHVRVHSSQATYEAERLVVTTGPWTGSVLADLGLPLTVRRVVNIHVAPTRPELYLADGCPTFAMAVPEGEYYGMPDAGLKIGRGDIGDVCTPDSVRRDVTPDEIATFRRVLEHYLPGAAGEVTSTFTCLYTMTPDEHFVIDQYPGVARVVFACGFSGHGFKFSPVVGEVLADLAVDGRTNQPVGFLSAARFTAELRGGEPVRGAGHPDGLRCAP